MSLRDLVPPDVAAAMLGTWPSEPAVHRRPASPVDTYGALATLDDYIDHDLLDPARVAAVLCGRAAHPGRFSRDGRMRSGRLRALQQEGHTLNLRHFDRTHPGLARTCRALAAETHTDVYVSAIVTPAGRRGLGHHWDQFTGIVAQIAGRKRWPVWTPHVIDPFDDWHDSPDAWTHELRQRLDREEPWKEFDLAPGDTLVIPRGWIHAPHCTGTETSVHLTFAVQDRTWMHAARALLDTLADEAAFGTTVPPSRAHTGMEVETVRTMLIRHLTHL